MPRRGLVEFLQLIPNVPRQADHEIAGRAAIAELGVLPEVAEHLQQVRLAASVEAADPRGDLAVPVQVLQVLGKDALHRMPVLAITHERGQLGTQLVFILWHGLSP